MNIVGKQTLADQVLELYTSFKKGRDISENFKILAEQAELIKNEFYSTNDKWLAFHRQNPDVYKKFERIARRRARAGEKVLSPNAVLAETGQRLTNDFSPYYARLFIQNNPTKKELFRIVPCRADALFPLRRPR